jgi:hypothetical protein
LSVQLLLLLLSVLLLLVLLLWMQPARQPHIPMPSLGRAWWDFYRPRLILLLMVLLMLLFRSCVVKLPAFSGLLCCRSC